MSLAPRFPPGFRFGAATSAYQIEGATRIDGRTDSIWDAFCRLPGAVLDGSNGDVACDHYHRMPEDVRIMRELGLHAYRFSASWARVRPDGGEANPRGIDFYDRLVDELLAADIEPWCTLYHWDLPQALQERGGWATRDTAYRFVEYALTLHDALSDRVRHWTTLNEPWCSAFLGYCAGAHAPGIADPASAVIASHHLLLAHGEAVRALRAVDRTALLGVTLNQTVADPAEPADPDDVAAAARIDGQFNRWFLDPLLRGAYPRDVREAIGSAAFDEAVRHGDLETIATPIDFLGVNYYQGEAVTAHPDRSGGAGDQAPTERPTSSPFPDHQGIGWVDRGLPRTGMGWDVQPEGLTRTLRRIHDEYTAAAGIPLYVTENGSAWPDVVEESDGAPVVRDRRRAEYLLAHLDAVRDAVDAGVPVGGYFAWSLLDNFEWAWGYGARFGIVRVDFDTGARLVKESGRVYAAAIERG